MGTLYMIELLWQSWRGGQRQQNSSKTRLQALDSFWVEILSNQPHCSPKRAVGLSYIHLTHLQNFLKTCDKSWAQRWEVSGNLHADSDWPILTARGGSIKNDPEVKSEVGQKQVEWSSSWYLPQGQKKALVPHAMHMPRPVHWIEH